MNKLREKFYRAKQHGARNLLLSRLTKGMQFLHEFGKYIRQDTFCFLFAGYRVYATPYI